MPALAPRRMPAAEPSKGTALRVLYVTMQFPVPSEAFAAVELRALRRCGASVGVACLRRRPKDSAALCAQRGLADLALDHNSLAASGRGLLFGLRHPTLLADLLATVLRHGWRQPRHLLRGLAVAPRILDIFAAIRRRPPDVVHLFWGHYPSLLGLLLIKHQPRILLSLFLGAYDLERRYGGSAALARCAAVVWTHAAANRPAILALGAPATRLQVCYRGIEPVAEEAEKVPGRIIAVGRLITDKGFDDALRAFQAIHRARPQASLEILGDGPAKGALRQLCEQLGLGPAVQFLGHLDHADALARMAKAEVMLALSRHSAERLPNAVKEAMARGCITVAARSPGIEELIETGIDGYIVTPNDHQTAADHVLAVLGDEERRRTMAERARDKIATRFDIDRLTRQRCGLWRDLLTRRQGAAAGGLGR